MENAMKKRELDISTLKKSRLNRVGRLNNVEITSFCCICKLNSTAENLESNKSE